MKEKTEHRLAFDLYVRLGPSRSLEALRKALLDDPSGIGLRRAPSPSTLEAWSSAFHWQDRLLDLEREARERDREAQLRALQEMAERHVKEGLALQQKGVERLQQVSPTDMNVGDAIRAVTEGVRLERLARGEPTDNIKQDGDAVHGHINLSGFSNEDLRGLAELAERRAAGGADVKKQRATWRPVLAPTSSTVSSGRKWRRRQSRNGSPCADAFRVNLRKPSARRAQ